MVKLMVISIAINESNFTIVYNIILIKAVFENL